METIANKLSDRKIAVCKEITKINERVFVGFPTEVLREFNDNPKNILGEFVVVIEGKIDSKQISKKTNLEISNVIRKLLEKFTLTDTVEIVHKFVNITKKELYKMALEIQNEK